MTATAAPGGVSQTVGEGGTLQQANEGVAPDRDKLDRSARTAGQLLILTAIVTLVAVAGRVAADADRETLQETLAAIAESRLPYALSGAGRLASGVSLGLAAWYLSRTWIIRERHATPAVPAILGISGILTGISGLAAVLLATTLPGSGEAAGSFHEMMAGARWFTGAAGFSAAGLALIIASFYQYRGGGMLRMIAPMSAILGAAMQFIWIDAATGLHRVSGVAFFVWLVLVGLLLVTGQVERHYRARQYRAESAIRVQ